jgi:2-keto-3-deoxy-L-fuconate dehydrogenase
MTDRVVVVTGSAGGIGSKMVEAFEAEGDIVVGLDLTDGFDITDPQACASEVARIETDHGRIDVLCNNAGIGAVGDVVAATPEEWRSVFAVNVFGLAYLSAAVLPGMRIRGSGAIVNTCSVVAETGLVERAVYGASKGAVHALTMAMAADEAQYGIRVNCISPGTVRGPWVEKNIANSEDPDATRKAMDARQPLGRLVEPEEVAAAAVYLAASSTYTTGISLRLDGGTTSVRIVR